MVYPAHTSDRKFEYSVDLSLTKDENKPHYIYIKDFSRIMWSNKTKCRTKKHFSKYCLQYFSNEKLLEKHKENCLKINSKLSLKLKNCLTKFKNHFKQLAVPFKIYADFECNVEWVQCNNKIIASYSKKCQDHIRWGFAYKLCAWMIHFARQLFFTKEKIQFINRLKQFLKKWIFKKKGKKVL